LFIIFRTKLLSLFINKIKRDILNKILLIISLLLALATANLQTKAQESLDLHVPLNSEPTKASTTDYPLIINRKVNSATSLYIDTVDRKITGTLNSWPRADLKTLRYTEVSVIITIANDGSLVDVSSRKVLLTEEMSKLMNIIIKAITYAAPFSPPPEEVIQNHKSLQFSRLFSFESKR
jgi:hypothetical protein